MANSPTPPSSSLPQPLSYQQLLGSALSSFAASIGVNDLNVGSATTSFFQVVALIAARSSGDIFQILRDFNLSRATGSALQNLAIEYGVPPLGSKVSTGFVTVVDLSFQKISTVIYAGVNPPIPGSTTIYASSAGNFPSTGSVYLGRGTVNVEGPLSYNSVTPIGSYYSLSLTSPTTKYHNIGESVILSQGGVRVVPINTIVLSPGIGTTQSVQYSVTQTGTILDGETTVINIPITALLPGSSGNVAGGAISQFSGNPSGLPNASVTNPLALTTGAATETDDQLRVRVQNKLASTGLGTVVAIESSLQGVQAPNSSDTIVSTDILNSSSNTIVYIDNGSVLEATHLGVPIEAIVNSALGGEKFFQLQTGGKQTSVTKAFLQTVASEPFNLSGGEILAVVVGNITYEHTFQAADFANPGSATAYEVSASINADTLLNFEAVTAGGAAYVVIRPEDETTNIIQITTPPSPSDVDANLALQFPSQKAETLRLYKNGKLLIEDGVTASVFTQSQSFWSPTIASGETITIAVDGTAPITYTITDADFVLEGTYISVSSSNSLQSWVNVFNNVITGITASIVGSTIEISSNLGAINRSQVVISNSSSLVTKGMFSSIDLSAVGAASQYILDRNTAQIELVSALVKGDSLSAGDTVTQANIDSEEISGGSVGLISDGHIWISIDSNAIIIPNIMSGSTLSVSVSGSTVTYTSNSGSSFSNVNVGDYVIVWSEEIPANDRFEGRVHAVTGSTLSIKVTAAEAAAVTPISNAPFVQGLVVVRTQSVPQKFTVIAGTSTLYTIVSQLQSQTDELTFSVVGGTKINVVTNTDDTSGQITIVTSDSSGSLLEFVSGANSVSQDALIAFYQTQATTSEMPLFFNSSISTDSYIFEYTFAVNSATASSGSVYTNNGQSFTVNPSITSSNVLVATSSGAAPAASGVLTKVSGVGDTTITFTSVEPVNLIDVFTTTSLASLDPNDMISFLNPYGVINDEQPFNENAQISGISGTFLSILPEYPNIKRLRVADRLYVANPLDFGYNDTVVAIVDNNTVGETYTLPLYRRAIVNSSYPSNNFSFDAYDVDSGPTASFATNFSNFEFANFKALLQAKYVLKQSNPQTALLFRSTLWGRSGEDVNVSYVYPASANQPINSNVTISANNNVSIQISLMSGNAISTSIAANTQWNVTVSPNTPVSGTDQVTYAQAGQYTFTVSAANATAGAVYRNHGQNFTVSSTISGGTTLTAVGINGAPLSSGTLTKQSGTGDATITFSAFSFSGFGTSPALALSGSEYVTILPSTGFNVRNTGTFRVSTAAGFTPTTVAFSVQTPNGSGLAQFGVVTGVINGMNFYSPSSTTAAAVNTYVNANLSQYVTTTIVNDGGTSGSGVIGLSTYEDSGFVAQSYYLKDGINWIFSSDTTGSPQFTFKKPLQYPSDTGYSFFSSGDEVRLIPTTMEQVKNLWNVLAVSGFTTVGTIEVSDRGNKLQLATNTIGSVGSVQIVGGSGNEYTFPIITSGQLLGNNQMIVTANAIASQFVASDQWFKLQAQNNQNKNTGIDSNTSVTVLSNTPSSGKSTVTLLNQNSGQRYFGSPRSYTRIQGDTFRIEPQGSLACLSWNGVGSSPSFSSSLNFNDSGGWTVNVSASGIYSVASGNTKFSALSIGDLIVITGCVNASNNGSFFVQSVALDGLSFGVANPLAVTESATAISSGQFSCISSVSEGDTVILSSPFSPLNQGSYRVIRMNNSSIWYENSDVVEEEVLCSANTISTGYNSSTVFNLTASGGVATLAWTGTGTAPSLGVTLPGDVVTFGSGFSSPNQGSFMVKNSGPSQQQVEQLTFPSGSSFTSSGPANYFEIWNGGNANQYYVWFNVSGGTNTDPAPGGFTGIEVTINNSDSSSTVASEVNTALAAMAATTSSVSGNVVTVTSTVSATTNSPVNVSMPAAFSFLVTQTGQRTFLRVINPSAGTQSGISSVTFSINRPQMQFFQYEATVPGDQFLVSGSVLGSGNAGSYDILQVLSPTTAVISGNISQQYATNLAGNSQSVSVQEGVAYTGYKQIAYVASEPGTIVYNDIIFNTSAQYDKITSSAGVGITSLSKLNFPTTIKNGIDSYNYDTGLIGEANRVVYGDPRDSVTYPGVNAAGTDIFIRESLLKRIQIALSIRTNIGVSFPQITSQIQSSVYALVRANPVGESLDLSQIVETVRAIPGVTSVVLTNPEYNVSNDEIQLVTGQKAFIASQTSDISVSLIGS